MNKVFQRVIKRGITNKNLVMLRTLRNHYQQQIMIQPIQNPIIIIDTKYFNIINPNKLIINDLVKQEPSNEKKVVSRQHIDELDFLNKMDYESARELNEYLVNRPNNPIKKPIITPSGIRTAKLVIPGPPKDELDFLDKMDYESKRKLNEYLVNIPKNPNKKPIITPNGIRTAKLVMSGQTENEFEWI